MDLLQYYGFDWLAVIIGAIGIWQLGNKKRSGFLFYMAAAAAGFTFAFFANSVAYMVANLVAFFLQLRGFLKWGKDDSKKG